MSGHMWIQDNEGKCHPDDSVLLAYTRRQLSMMEAQEVSEHLARCQPCSIQCAQFKYFGDGLQNALAYSNPLYPSIVTMLGEQLESPDRARQALRERRQKRLREDVALGKALAIFALKKALGVRSQQHSRPRNRAMASVPVASLLVLVVLVLSMVVAVLAFRGYINTKGNSGQSGSTPLATPTMPPVVAHSTPTPTPTPVPTLIPTPVTNTHGAGSTVGGTPTASPTLAENQNPSVYLCNSAGDLKQSNLDICGRNFKPGDKVILYEYIPGIGYRPKPPIIIADAQGTISIVWTITNCRLMPTAVYAIDLRDNAQTAFVPVNVTVGNCQPNVKPKSPTKN